MYAIFETGGKQHKVEVGSVIYVEKLETPENDVVKFDTVLVTGDEKKGTKVGAPYVKNTFVGAKVLKTGKGKKLTVFTYKPKKNEKRKLGHRQPYTKLEIMGIGTAAAVNKALGITPVKSKAAETKETSSAE